MDYKILAEFYAWKADRAEEKYKDLLADKDKRIQELEILLDRPNKLRKLKAQAMKRDKYKCVKCGSKDHLHLHHKTRVIDGGLDVIGNVEILCNVCHAGEHKADSGLSGFILANKNDGRGKDERA